ncbi:hypothetical protein OIU78_010660 [Salix suchowensis]|uniref:CHECKPOINT PROTEIN n=1 Tax=Salix koriyanagi TaxID=2511006 RepID=A0A9Q0Q676_9ROSI|nr:hypothetical protein OIU78_010660 [Salix suchowensis]KAJ6700708.1 CHECKPOINT PROTEIN [Salix koriyanagi]
MKFKAVVTENGVSLLDRRFLPALEKMGKICHLFLTRDHAFFLHNLITTADGIQFIAQFRKQALFDDYRISSQNEDRIAFAVDISLLLRAVRSSVSIISGEFGIANRLQVKLVKKLPPNSTQPMPFLTFETKGYKSAVIQDVPISKPLSRAQLLQLQAALDAAQDLPPTLVQISTTLITLGAEFRKLLVVGDKAQAPSEDRDLSAQTRSGRAILMGDAQSVQGACLTVIFQFFIPGTRQTDKSISLHCRLPVLDPGSS